MNRKSLSAGGGNTLFGLAYLLASEGRSIIFLGRKSGNVVPLLGEASHTDQCKVHTGTWGS